jgi:PEGA domain-containing protein
MVLASLLVFAAMPARAADDATALARSHYEMGLKLFDAREHEQALIEFSRANEIKPRPAALFMMAQCEYLMGRLKDASVHYQRYATENPNGEFAELARDRVESIAKRPSTFVVNSVPEDVTLRISPEGEIGKVVASGQAPNNFSVPRGRYRVDVVKPNYQGQTRIVEVDVGETKPLFFKLDPIPARLEIETNPPGATLYVNGNRARNPYRQDVSPGHIEIFAEATDYESKTTEINLAPGEKKLFVGDGRLRLQYVQRSGRPELLFASGLIGALVGAGAIAAAIGKDFEGQDVASVALVTGGGVAGAVAGTVIGTPLIPSYIPDNRAFFILGTTWIGAAEGMGLGFVYQQVSINNGMQVSSDPAEAGNCPPGSDPCRPAIGNQLRAAFVGSLPGLAIGLTAGSLLAKKAPTYGRVTMIHSAALGGIFAGALTQVAVKWKPYGESWEQSYRLPRDVSDAENGKLPNGGDCPAPPPGATATVNCVFRTSSVFDLAPGALIGLNVGLLTGLLGSYLADQSKYGPSLKRVLLIDAAAGAAALAAGVGACVSLTESCLRKPQPDDDARALAAGAALLGGGLGLLGGILLTRHVDDEPASTSTSASTTSVGVPVATFAPMRDGRGGMVPGFAAMGFF